MNDHDIVLTAFQELEQAWNSGDGGRRPYSSMIRRVAEGDRKASPAATTRSARRRSSEGAFFSRKPLAPPLVRPFSERLSTDRPG
jgi:hypothetical protein